MSLNKGRPPISLKAKLTRLFVLLFMITQLLCVTVMFLIQRNSMYTYAKNRAKVFWTEFTYEYLTGEELTNLFASFSPDQVDPVMLKAMHREEPRFVPSIVIWNQLGLTTVIGAADNVVYRFTAPKGNPQAITKTRHDVADRVKYLNTRFNGESYGEDVNHYYFLVLSPENKVLAKSQFTDTAVDFFTRYRLPADQNRSKVKLRKGHSQIYTTYYRLFDGNILVIAEDLRQLDQYLMDLIYSLLMTLLFSLGVSLYSGHLIAEKFVNGIKRITKSVRKIESGNYSERVAHGTEGAEINQLVDAFNDMSHKTEKLLFELKTISDNMAHDIKTPITRMRAMAEMSFGASKDNELASDVAEECSNMLTTINTMLEITQTECNLGNAVATVLDFAAIAEDTITLFSTVADDKGVSIKTDISETTLPFTGSKVHIQRLIGNLLDNAIKFTPSGGTVSISVKSDDGDVLLTVADTGCGIPQKDLEHIFDRFYRSDSSRNIPGNGLGLSLVKAIVESCGGQIIFSSEVNHGTLFTVTLPKRLENA